VCPRFGGLRFGTHFSWANDVHRITASETAWFLRDVARLRITVDETPVESALLDLARRHQLTVYDAAYLELARRRSLLLATLDRHLARAAREEGVGLLG
jgi:predicted nucleic acid-binding protein